MNPDSGDVGALSGVATYGALEQLKQRLAELAAEGQYQKLDIQEMKRLQSIVYDEQKVEVLMSEKYGLQTYQQTDEGDQLVGEESFDGNILYTLIIDEQGWKVAQWSVKKN